MRFKALQCPPRIHKQDIVQHKRSDSFSNLGAKRANAQIQLMFTVTIILHHLLIVGLRASGYDKDREGKDMKKHVSLVLPNLTIFLPLSQSDPDTSKAVKKHQNAQYEQKQDHPIHCHKLAKITRISVREI